jgi:predicted patatin/cPLA2 family phospholipase
MSHPVIGALRERPADARIALVIEGGGMRGAVSGGMGLGLDELGLNGAFDAVYGASAGALNGLWFVSGRVRVGSPTWTDQEWADALIRRRRVVLPGPVVDVDGLVEERYERLSPGIFAAALAAPTELHPIATDVRTGQPVDLYPAIDDEATLRVALRASASLPLLAGPPVELAGRRYLDAGLSAAIPIRAALADGATHVLVLRSRRRGEVVEPSTGRSAALVTRMLRRIDPAVAAAFASRPEREGEDEALLARHDADPQLTPHILSIRPPDDAPVPGRLERDLGVVAAALEGGRQAAHTALGR